MEATLDQLQKFLNKKKRREAKFSKKSAKNYTRTLTTIYYPKTRSPTAIYPWDQPLLLLLEWLRLRLFYYTNQYAIVRGSSRNPIRKIRSSQEKGVLTLTRNSVGEEFHSSEFP
eukprot:GHVP01008836.1.p1 GENE.GHVP01008836.1~~GHVP01008836.1.p1  ORF type:complete len:114 (-),score=5.77 GHVP01008836.1:201-542(-)